MIETEGAAILIRHQPLPLALRLFAGVLGLAIATGIPGPFLIHADLTRIFPDLLLAPFFILAPAALGIFFLYVAFAPVSALRLDAAGGTAQLRRRGPLGRRDGAWPLDALPPPRVIQRDSEDGRYPVLVIDLPGRGRMEEVDFATTAEAEAWRDRIAGLIAGA